MNNQFMRLIRSLFPPRVSPWILLFSGWLVLGVLAEGAPPLPTVRILPPNLKIMPLGDSITCGYPGTNAGYRGPLYDLLKPLASNFVFLGSSTNAWSVTTLPLGQWHNEGHGSYGSEDIFTNLDGFNDTVFRKYGGKDRDPRGGHWLDGIADGANARPAVYPDVILLMVGANDRDHTNGAPERLDRLVAKLVTLRTNAYLIIARIPPETDSAAHRAFVTNYNQWLDTIVAKYTGTGHVSSVDLNTGFPVNGLSQDGVHPSDVGYNFMASLWCEAILAAVGAPPPPLSQPAR